VPLTDFQRTILALLAETRTPDSYLAGGAALHFSHRSKRFSDDLNFFHDSAERVASAFEEDKNKLHESGFELQIGLSQPGFIRAIVSRDDESTQIDWAHDSAWRFMPPVRDDLGGFILHEVDLAVNKTLALAGRNEPRDYVDILYVHEHVLPLGALCWAAVGKDPGFTPESLLSLLRRRGRYQPKEISRLDLTEPFDLTAGKAAWLQALDEAESFLSERPAEELGCLYYRHETERFVEPAPNADLRDLGISPHFGSPGGVLPQPVG